MKREQLLIGGLDRILSVREVSNLLTIPVDELLKFYAGQLVISLRNLLKRICRFNPNYHFLIIAETLLEQRANENKRADTLLHPEKYGLQQPNG